MFAYSSKAFWDWMNDVRWHSILGCAERMSTGWISMTPKNCERRVSGVVRWWISCGCLSWVQILWALQSYFCRKAKEQSKNKRKKGKAWPGMAFGAAHVHKWIVLMHISLLYHNNSEYFYFCIYEFVPPAFVRQASEVLGDTWRSWSCCEVLWSEMLIWEAEVSETEIADFITGLRRNMKKPETQAVNEIL